VLDFFYILLGGLLARADGWGTDNPRLKRLADFFNAATCSGIFAVASTIYADDIIAGICAGLAFYIWRAPGFNRWENWRTMFWRGMWASAIGFTIMSFVLYGHAYGALLSIPMGAAQALCYSGGYKFLQGRIAQAWVHPVIEIASGIFFVAHAIILMWGLLWMLI